MEEPKIDYVQLMKDIALKFVNEEIYKKFSFYKRLFVEPAGEIKSQTVNSKTNVLLDVISTTWELFDVEAEVFDLYTKHMCLEALTNSMRGGERLEKDISFLEEIEKQPFSNIMVSPEVSTKFDRMVDFKYLPEGTDTFEFMGVQLIGTFKGKDVFCNPYLAYNGLAFFNDGFASFDVKLHTDDKPGDWFFFFRMRRDNQKIKFYLLKGMEEFIFEDLSIPL